MKEHHSFKSLCEYKFCTLNNDKAGERDIVVRLEDILERVMLQGDDGLDASQVDGHNDELSLLGARASILAVEKPFKVQDVDKSRKQL